MRTRVKALKQPKSGKYIVYGVHLPKEVISFFPVGVEFTIEMSGSSILLTSGCSIQPTEQQVKDYNFEDTIVS